MLFWCYFWPKMAWNLWKIAKNMAFCIILHYVIIPAKTAHGFSKKVQNFEKKLILFKTAKKVTVDGFLRTNSKNSDWLYIGNPWFWWIFRFESLVLKKLPLFGDSGLYREKSASRIDCRHKTCSIKPLVTQNCSFFKH